MSDQPPPASTSSSPIGGPPAPLPDLPPAYPARAAWGTATRLRAWQSAALETYFAAQPSDFLTVATPGAGKTTFALAAARHQLTTLQKRRDGIVTQLSQLRDLVSSFAQADDVLEEDPSRTPAQIQPPNGR